MSNRLIVLFFILVNILILPFQLKAQLSTLKTEEILNAHEVTKCKTCEYEMYKLNTNVITYDSVGMLTKGFDTILLKRKLSIVGFTVPSGGKNKYSNMYYLAFQGTNNGVLYLSNKVLRQYLNYYPESKELYQKERRIRVGNYVSILGFAVGGAGFILNRDSQNNKIIFGSLFAGSAVIFGLTYRVGTPFRKAVNKYNECIDRGL